jgi:inorganic pyrophosphatase
MQLIISTVLLTPCFFIVAYWVFPDEFYMTEHTIIRRHLPIKKPWQAAVCSVMGVWAGLLIGYYTEYMTSHSYRPVREVAEACKTGSGTNIIYGLALGYNSTIVPIISIALTAYVSTKMLSFYGVALGALGMLSNLTIGLAIDGYGPISDNAGGIAEMAELGADVRERTDALDAAGNTTAAIGKGFAIGSAALVGLSLYGGFVTRAQTTKHGIVLNETDIMNPMIFTSLLIGAMLPYVFCAMTMKSVGFAALQMVQEIRGQIKRNPGILDGTVEPDFQACIAISTRASLHEMIPPGILVIGTPILVGFLFGPQGIAGLLPGSLISGVQLAISAANTGGAWDNAKKYIESGQLVIDGEVRKKGSDEHKAAVIGDTVGDPLKDTSGPSLNILIKLMAILSLVLADFFCRSGVIERKLHD